MAVAYVDSSALIAIAFSEPNATGLQTRLDQFEGLVASNLVEAEFRSVLAREGFTMEGGTLDRIQWIFPLQSLSEEFALILRVGYLRGADLWHVATALYAASDITATHFITLDNRQRAVAEALGFLT